MNCLLISQFLLEVLTCLEEACHPSRTSKYVDNLKIGIKQSAEFLKNKHEDEQQATQDKPPEGDKI